MSRPSKIASSVTFAKTILGLQRLFFLTELVFVVLTVFFCWNAIGNTPEWAAALERRGTKGPFVTGFLLRFSFVLPHRLFC